MSAAVFLGRVYCKPKAYDLRSSDVKESTPQGPKGQEIMAHKAETG